MESASQYSSFHSLYPGTGQQAFEVAGSGNRNDVDDLDIENMTEIEVKIKSSSSSSGPLRIIKEASMKKSRKNKNPICRLQQRKYSKEVLDAVATDVATKPASGLPSQLPGTGFKSYSDYMRSLAAKYNNNDYNASPSTTNGLDNPFPPFKTGTPDLQPNPLLGGGFPTPFPFPFAAVAGLSGLGSRLANPGTCSKDGAGSAKCLPGLSADGLHGLQSMMDLTSTHAALLSTLAARSPMSTTSAFASSSSTSNSSAESAVSPCNNKRPNESPLDLSGPSPSPPPFKRPEELPPDHDDDDNRNVLSWSVAKVVDFVSSIDICKEYAAAFGEHNIDGSSLPLLTEDHLTVRLGMKLGPALKLKSMLTRRMGLRAAHVVALCAHCAHCRGGNESRQNVTDASKVPDPVKKNAEDVDRIDNGSPKGRD